jgi:hypothetical protein
MADDVVDGRGIDAWTSMALECTTLVLSGVMSGVQSTV